MGHLQSRKDLRGAADLAGKYRLIAELGQGGMATVYLAVAMGNSGFRKLAVVKVLRPEFAVDDEFIQMFLDEARLCARLSHPNIVHTYDVGVDESGHLIAMEYLDGVSLHAATAKLGRNAGLFTFPLQAHALLEVVEGLRYAHELRDYDGRSLEIVHRDVTPHNIFVTYDGQVKLLDFGIAKAATSSVKTATGVIKGKLTYMAPEQARGDPVDARADLYAVGVMLWEAATGRRRWPTGLTEPALFTRLATGELPEVPNVGARGFPAEIDGIIMRSLAPNPGDRYQTAAELRDELGAALRKMEPVSMRDLGTLLSSTFDEDRRRIRHVIEEQFRTLESGSVPAPNELPAVPHISYVTASELIERSSSQPGLSGAKAAPALDILAESQSRRITAPAPDPKVPASRSRMQVAIVAAGILVATAFVLGVAVPRVRPPPPEPAVSLLVPKPDPPRLPAEAPVATDAPPASPPAESVAQIGADGPSTAGSARHAQGPGHRGPVPVHDPVHPVTSASAVPPVPPASATSTEEPPGEITPLRTPQGRPKVQLERDNPWP
jgi:serine/threonine protein kinase